MLLFAFLLAACLAQDCPDVAGFYGYQSKISQGGGAVTAGGPNGVWKFALNLCGPLTQPNNCASAKPASTPLWGCESYDPNVGKFMAAGNNNNQPNANPTPGAWTVTPMAGNAGLVFTATGGDASSSNPGCFLSMQVTVSCDATAGNGIQNLQFIANSACPNTPFTFTAKSAAACQSAGPPPPPPTPTGIVAFPATGLNATSSFGFVTQRDCRTFAAALTSATNCTANALGCSLASLAVTLNGACDIPSGVFTQLVPSYNAYVGPPHRPGTCPAAAVLCLDTETNMVVISHGDMQSCLTDYVALDVENGTVAESCRNNFAITITGQDQPGPFAIIEGFTALNFTEFSILPL